MLMKYMSKEINYNEDRNPCAIFSTLRAYLTKIKLKLNFIREVEV